MRGMVAPTIFAEMAFNGNNLVVYDRNRGASDTEVGAYVCRWKWLGTMWSGILLELEYTDVPYVRQNNKLEYVCRICDWLQKGTVLGCWIWRDAVSGNILTTILWFKTLKSTGRSCTWRCVSKQ